MTEPESFADKLEELAKKVERATFLIENLREENRKLKAALAEKVKESVAPSAKSGDVAELEQRLATLTKRNQDLEEFLRDNETWIKRKDDIKKRLETILEKVAKLEEPHEEIFVEEEEGDL
jgi:ABC-type transporter Mla subunit MlaD